MTNGTPPPGRTSRDGRLAAGICLLLAAGTLAAFWGVHRAGFVFDDEGLILANPHLADGLTGTSVRWAFTSFYMSNWQPLTWLSHLVVVEFFGLAPGPHHVVNLALHVAAALALFLVLRAATGATWCSAAAAALFAVHPLRAESVAWVAERKDTLSTLFWLLALGAYLRYARAPSLSRYLAVAGAFALGLLSKAMVVTLPAVLLLLDVWPLGRMRPAGDGQAEVPVPVAAGLGRLVLEKLPLAALSAVVAGLALAAQGRGRAVVSLELLPLGERISNALLSAVSYLGMTVWPLRLGAYYPLPAAAPGAAAVAGASVLLAGITLACLGLRRRAPFLAVGWLWYLVTLLPVSGLVQVGGQAMADRYTYLPLIGPVVALVWGVEAVTRPVRRRGVFLAPLALAVVGALAVLCRAQVGYWRDDLTLYRRTLEVTTGNWMIRNNLGKAHAARGDRDAAIAEFRESLRIKPSFVLARHNLAATLAQAGRADEAVEEYRRALDYNLFDADLHVALAALLEAQGSRAKALSHYRLALQLRPESADLAQTMGLALLRQGDLPEAARHFRDAVRLAPGSSMAQMNLGNALAGLGETEEARGRFLEALRLDPLSPEANYNYGNLLAAEGKTSEAVLRYREALRGRPAYLEARINLGKALYERGRPTEAIAEYEEALRLAPDSPEALANLGVVYLGLGRTQEAEAHLRRALLLRPDLEPARRALESVERGSGAGKPAGPSPARP